MAAQMVDFDKILPPNYTGFERAFCAALNTHELPINIDINWNANLVAEKLLPFCAWQLSVDAWDTNWALQIKRNQVLNSPIIHRQKGTIGSIKKIIAGFGGSVTLREWHQQIPKGTPHTFKITLSFANIEGVQPDQEYLNNILKMINAAKPVRSHYTFTIANNIEKEIAIVAVLRPLRFETIDCEAA